MGEDQEEKLSAVSSPELLTKRQIARRQKREDERLRLERQTGIVSVLKQLVVERKKERDASRKTSRMSNDKKVLANDEKT